MKIRKRVSPRTANRRVDALGGAPRRHERPFPKLPREQVWRYWNGPLDTTSDAQRLKRLIRRLTWVGQFPAQARYYDKKLLRRARRRMKRTGDM